jgi:hypothetical protein
MAKARKTDPVTSHVAAQSVKNVTSTQAVILQLLDVPYGMTDVALVKAYNKVKDAPRASDSGIRSRRAELAAMGKVADTGNRVKLPSGRHAIVWQVA